MPIKALRDVRGSNYSALVINKTIERNRILEPIVGVLQERQTICSQISVPAEQLRTKCTNDSVEGYASPSF